MRWRWKRDQSDELAEAKKDQARAEQRTREAQPLVRSLQRWERANHMSARVRSSWLGGQQG